MQMLRFSLLAFVFAGLYALPAAALEGDLDPAFGEGGQVAIIREAAETGNGTRPTGDLAILADGRFLWAVPLDDGSVWVGRMKRDGTPDAFGSLGNGRVTIPACGPSRNARLIANGDGGAIAWASNCLVHVMADGSIDPAFAGGALPPAGFSASGFARDSSGRLVLAGKAGQEIDLYRFTSQGLPDFDFGVAGHVSVVVPTTDGTQDLHALALRADGRILVGGSRGNTMGPSLFVAQYSVAGVLDSTWSDDGIVDIEPPANHVSLVATALALDADGSLVVSGVSSDGGESCCRMLARFDDSGQLVPGFGMRIYSLDGLPGLFPFFEQRDGIALLSDQRIMLGAITFSHSAPFTHRTQFSLIRTHADGSLDLGFGHSGWNSYTIDDPEDIGQYGDYNQMHAIGYDSADDSMVVLGRTFFEDKSNGNAYVSMVRALFGRIFSNGFDM